jgi:hypothetical protein
MLNINTSLFDRRLRQSFNLKIFFKQKSEIIENICFNEALSQSNHSLLGYGKE